MGSIALPQYTGVVGIKPAENNMGGARSTTGITAPGSIEAKAPEHLINIPVARLTRGGHAFHAASGLPQFIVFDKGLRLHETCPAPPRH